ncbi:MAG: FAD-dependent monooxygenase [Hyphomicrobiales bacterium]|nr:FAD-dependent monooxygenase [Hyphomicrobiales bacterium]
MPKAIIVGGSIGGLFSALCLRQAGWDVQIHERTAGTLQGRGAGIVTQPDLLRIMQALGLDVASNFGVRVEQRRLIAADGATLSAMPFPQTVTAWDAIYTLLRRAASGIPMIEGVECVAADNGPDGVSVRFHDGQSVDGDILVGADGVRSTVRGLLDPSVVPQFAGYVGWRCLAEESALPPDVREHFFGDFCFHYPQGEQVLSYPVAGVGNNLTPGHRRLNIVWYRPVSREEDLTRMLTDESGKLHSLGIPPPLISASVLKEATDAALNLPEPFRSAIAVTDQLFFQPIYDVVSSQIAFGRTVLTGDAAFTARPHVGAGVTKAAADAACLAGCLSSCMTAEQSTGGALQSALANYNMARIQSGMAVIAETKRLGKTVNAGHCQLNLQDMISNMRDTATLEFLDR